MTVPPFTEDPEGARPYFRKLRELRDRLAARQLAVSHSRRALHGHVARLRGRHRRRFNLRAHRHRHLRHTPQAMIPIRDTPSGATFQVKVHPRARKNAITGVVGEALKLALTSPPWKAAPTRPASPIFAEFLNVPRSSVTIAAGETSRQKLIRVAGLRAAQVEAKLRTILD